MSGPSADGLASAVQALLTSRDTESKADNSQDRIGGSLTVISGKQAYTLQDEQNYYVGSLPTWLGLQWFFARHPLTLVGALLLSALVIAVLLYLSLRARAQRRLGS